MDGVEVVQELTGAVADAVSAGGEALLSRARPDPAGGTLREEVRGATAAAPHLLHLEPWSGQTIDGVLAVGRRPGLRRPAAHELGHREERAPLPLETAVSELAFTHRDPSPRRPRRWRSGAAWQACSSSSDGRQARANHPAGPRVRLIVGPVQGPARPRLPGGPAIERAAHRAAAPGAGPSRRGTSLSGDSAWLAARRPRVEEFARPEGRFERERVVLVARPGRARCSCTR